MSIAEYYDGLAGVGLTDLRVTLTHEVADAMHGAIVQAVKPRVAKA